MSAVLLSGCATTPAPSPAWPWPDEPVAGQSDAPSQPQARSGPQGFAEPRRGSDAGAGTGAPYRDPMLAATEVGQSLVNSARSARDAGDYPRAVAQLERAVSIAPQDPVVWFELAKTRLAQGQYRQAENLAQRALDLAEQGALISAYCWQIIGDAREAQGDRQGARDARERARARS